MALNPPKRDVDDGPPIQRTNHLRANTSTLSIRIRPPKKSAPMLCAIMYKKNESSARCHMALQSKPPVVLHGR